VVAGDLAYVAAGVTLLAATDVFDAAGSVEQHGNAVIVWGVLFAAQTPMLVALILAGYLVENSDAPSTRITALATAMGLLAATAAGLVAVPLAGGVGVLIAFATAGIVQAATLRAKLTRPVPVEEDVHVAA
jgi:hypothetical protein